MFKNKPLLWLAAVGLGCLALFACAPTKAQKGAGDNAREEQSRLSEGFNAVQDSQPIPVFDYSQERQTLIDVLSARAHGTHGTAVVTSLDGTLLWWCPTQGAPIPSTYQISASTQYIDVPKDDSREKLPIDQGEPTGVYPGESAATWVLCLDNQGTPFALYDEANVRWYSGVIGNLPADKRAKVDEITYDFTVEKE